MNMIFQDVMSQLMRDLAVSETNKSVGSKKGGNIKKFLALISTNITQANNEQPVVLDDRNLSMSLDKINPLTIVSLRDAFETTFTDETCAKLVSDDMLALVNGKVSPNEVKSATTDLEKDLVSAWSIAQDIKNNIDADDKITDLLKQINTHNVANVQLAMTRVVGLELIIKHSLDEKASDLSIFKSSMVSEDEKITLV